jgi:hypothetical protein
MPILRELYGATSAAWSSAPYLEKQNETGGTGLIVPFLNISAAKKVTSA